MKKFIAIALVLTMALGLCACGGEKIDEETQEKLDLYDKYENFIELLEEEDYEGAYMKLVQMYQNSQGNNDDNNDPNPNDPNPTDPNPTDPEPTDPPEPTDEERIQLQQYYEIVDSLYRYEQNDYISVTEYDEEGNWIDSYDGQEALQFCFEQLRKLTVADDWTEWLQNYYNYGYDYNWDRMSLLSKFSLVENVVLNQKQSTTDNMGNVNDFYTVATWTYNTDGTLAMLTNPDDIFELITTDPFVISYNAYYTYDENGVVTQIRYGYDDSTNYLVTPTYDANGVKISDHVVNNSGETDITYTYNTQGQLTRIYYKPISSSGTSSYNYSIDYTYDANGNVVKEEWVYYSDYDEYYGCENVHEKRITEYTYDANGHLASGTYTFEDWSYTTQSHYDEDKREWIYETISYVYMDQKDTYTFTCDDQGRVVTINTTCGDSYYRYGDKAGELYSKSSYATKTIQIAYGNYYFYDLGD